MYNELCSDSFYAVLAFSCTATMTVVVYTVQLHDGDNVITNKWILDKTIFFMSYKNKQSVFRNRIDNFFCDKHLAFMSIVQGFKVPGLRVIL